MWLIYHNNVSGILFRSRGSENKFQLQTFYQDYRKKDCKGKRHHESRINSTRTLLRGSQLICNIGITLKMIRETQSKTTFVTFKHQNMVWCISPLLPEDCVSLQSWRVSTSTGIRISPVHPPALLPKHRAGCTRLQSEHTQHTKLHIPLAPRCFQLINHKFLHVAGTKATVYSNVLVRIHYHSQLHVLQSSTDAHVAQSPNNCRSHDPLL